MKFMKYRWLYFLVSGLAVGLSVLSLLLFGVKPSVDFTSGSLLEFESDTNLLEFRDQIAQEVETTYLINSIQQAGDRNYVFRGSELTIDQRNLVGLAVLRVAPDAVLVRFETLGPAISQELVRKTVTAIVLVAVIIALYVWYQFSQAKFGVCAILAMLHDTLILLGAFSALGHFLGVEVDVLFVTALLTTLSFSIHDTIVVYHRIRELQQTFPRYSTEERIDIAISETLTRSLNNSLTIIFALLSLALLSGPSLQWFAIALLIGAVAGTYSSSFTAAPLLLVWERVFEKKRNL